MLSWPAGLQSNLLLKGDRDFIDYFEFSQSSLGT